MDIRQLAKRLNHRALPTANAPAPNQCNTDPVRSQRYGKPSALKQARLNNVDQCGSLKGRLSENQNVRSSLCLCDAICLVYFFFRQLRPVQVPDTDFGTQDDLQMIGYETKSLLMKFNYKTQELDIGPYGGTWKNRKSSSGFLVFDKRKTSTDITLEHKIYGTWTMFLFGHAQRPELWRRFLWIATTKLTISALCSAMTTRRG